MTPAQSIPLDAVVQQMQEITDRLGIPLRVHWIPKDSDKHGELVEGNLFIYDKACITAWETFRHELFEFKFNEVSHGYRLIINGLIEVMEKMVYTKKEEFLEFNLRLAGTLNGEEAKK